MKFTLFIILWCCFCYFFPSSLGDKCFPKDLWMFLGGMAYLGGILYFDKRTSTSKSS